MVTDPSHPMSRPWGTIQGHIHEAEQLLYSASVVDELGLMAALAQRALAHTALAAHYTVHGDPHDATAGAQR